MPYELQFTTPEGVPVILLGKRPRYRFRTGELHFHHCPHCFEDGPCIMNCECEFDLAEDHILRGAPAVCDACRIFHR